MQASQVRTTVLRAVACIATTILLMVGPISAQDSLAPQNDAVVPDQFEAARLVWSTLIALDHANKTGNYSVLRDLGGPTFQGTNTPAGLAEIFRGLRQDRVELGRTVQLTPLYEQPPTIGETGRLQLRGVFTTRPAGIRFDLEFENVAGSWLIYNVGISLFQSLEPLAEE